MRGTLLEILDQLDAIDDTDRYNAQCIYAAGGPDATDTARALVCPADEEGLLTCSQDPSLSYVLEVAQAREAISVWSEWRGRRSPSVTDKYAAVMYLCAARRIPAGGGGLRLTSSAGWH